jgi:hypothetical protein
VSEIAPAEDSVTSKKRNAKDVQGVAKKSKSTLAEIYGTLVTMKHMAHGRLILTYILNAMGWLEMD